MEAPSKKDLPNEKGTEVFLSDYQKKLMQTWQREHKGNEPPPFLPAPNNTARWVNRHERRIRARRQRLSSNETLGGVSHWVVRYLKEMNQNAAVQAKYLSGQLDALLPEEMRAKQPQLVEIKEQNEPTADETNQDGTT